MKRYEEALGEYEDFTRLHPRNEVIPYVVYQMGMCHFNRILSIDRDQTAVHEALQIFERLVKTYPVSEYAARAKERIKECREKLAAHEFYVGRFYFKTEHYKAALGRFEGIIEEYPDTTLKEKAKRYAKRCEVKLGDVATSETPAYQRMAATDIEKNLSEREFDSIPKEKVGVNPRIPTKEKGPLAGPWENLALHEFHVGKFYFKTKRYKKALERFEGILKNYPKTRLREDVLYHIRESKERINEPYT
jgi:outer membrane protein assembly factor BamD (BamD/ComL family)